jgi:hypothetical protein
MIPCSAAFNQAVQFGSTVFVECDIFRNGLQIGSIDLLPGATITLDNTASSRRSFSGQTPNIGNAPHVATDMLAPYTIEAIPRIGLATPANPTGEFVQLGVFVVNVAEDDSTGLITLSGQDRSFIIAANKNQAPYGIAAGARLDTAIGNYLQAKYPGITFLPDGAAHAQIIQTALTYQTGSSSGDPWSNMVSLAAEFGRELFLDYLGRVVLRPIPDPSVTPPVWSFAPGTANLLLSSTHTMDTSQNIYNIFVVTGEGSGIATPVTATFAVTDPTSPIYPAPWPAGFGQRPMFFTSPNITTQAQALAVAQALYNRQPGSSDAFQLTAIPHPCLEPSDIVTYASLLTGAQANLQLANWQLQIDLQSPVQMNCLTAGAVAEQVLTDIYNATVN